LPDLSGNKKILIIRLGKIGDIIITSSVFDLLKKKYPGINISLLTLEKNREVLKYNPNIDRIYFTNKNLTLFFLLFKLRKNRYDIILDLNDDPSRTSGTIRRILKAGTTAAFNFDILPMPDIAVTQPPKNSTHIIERIQKLLEGLEIQIGNNELRPSLYLGKSELKDVEEQLAQYKNNSKIIAINLSAGAQIRYWPVPKWIELLTRISDKYPDYKFLLLSTDADKEICEKISNNISVPRLLSQKFNSFQHYASYICKADLLITSDTAAVHIGSAFNKPQIVFFPAVEWNFISWQPLSEISKSIISKAENLAAISVDEAWQTFEEIIKEI
jgi:ADP-heptose:LPS heptosyltransferase